MVPARGHGHIRACSQPVSVVFPVTPAAACGRVGRFGTVAAGAPAERTLVKLRVARHTDDLERIVAFYRDKVGLPELGRFTGHEGYDGVFLGVPGSGTQLEFTTGGEHTAPAPHPENLLVLYLDDEAQAREIAHRIGAPPVKSANPYWERCATTFADPDGNRLVLAVLQRDALW
jgi:catechol 2,3-dioxygenase-like lactoylglutathione lyase family enzyme